MVDLAGAGAGTGGLHPSPMIHGESPVAVEPFDVLVNETGISVNLSGTD
jgi:hypothetical protein